MTTLIYPIVYTPEDGKTFSIRSKIPIKRECPTLAPPFILNENDSWNCNLCGADKPFFIPFQTGDVMPLQTNFADGYNSNPGIINYGIKDSIALDWYVMIELQDESGVTISSDADFFCSEYWVAFSEIYGSAQTWFLNTALLPVNLDCFRLKITYYYFDQVTLTKEIERVIFTEYYRKIKDCETYSAIHSVYSTTDCYNNVYITFTNFLGTSNTAFYSFVRLEGEHEMIGDNVNVVTETDRNVILRREIIDEYRFKGGIVAPFFALMIKRAIRGKTVYLNGVNYQNFTISKNNDASREWVIDMNFNTTCTKDDRNCNL